MRLIDQLVKDLPISEILSIMQRVEEVTLKSNEVFISPGDLVNKVRYIQDGLVRAYAYDEDGRDITFIFRWENQFFRPYESLLDQPSKYYFQALEPTRILELDFQVIQDYIDANPVYAHKYNVILKSIMHEVFGHLESFVFLSPEMRYKKLIEEKPDIIHRVQDRYIASFLGVTPVSLSRIKKRISIKKH